MASSIPRSLLIVVCAAIFTTAFASTTDQTADRVLGQIDLNHNTINFGGPAALNGPSAAAADSQGHLYVVDRGNNRVLGFASAESFANGAAADLVIGEPDFYAASGGRTLGASTLNGPVAAAVDPAGNLYVSDSFDNRVLEFDAPFSSGYTAAEPASIIFGNTGSTVELCQNSTPSADTLCAPTGIACDAHGNLYVTDSGANRVLMYLNPKAAGGGTPGTPGSAGDSTADMVFGQSSLTSFVGCYTDQQPPPASGFCIPFGNIGGLAVDGSGNLFVADVGNARVLKFDTPLDPNSGEPGAGDTVADLVIGQTDLSAALQCDRRRRPGASVLCYPQGVAADLNGNVYISDGSRVLEFNTPASNGARANPGLRPEELHLGRLFVSRQRRQSLFCGARRD